MRPAQVLDSQADLLARCKDSRFQRALMGGLSRTFPPDGVDRWGRDAAARLPTAVKAAYAYHVSEDMAGLVEYAATQLDGTDQIRRDLAPTPFGIVRLERGLTLQDARGKTMKVNWIVWGEATSNLGAGLMVWLFNDHHDDPDDIARTLLDGDEHEKIRRVVGRWGAIAADFAVDGQRVGPAWAHTDPEHAARILADGDTPTPVTNASRYVLALFMLLRQEITATDDADLDRATRRRAGAVGIPDRVQVIYLRHQSARRAEGESWVQWFHRTPVRGYWRNQHYGPGNTLVRRVWVREHIRGPEGAPLVHTEKVYALHR